jgi:hypothetical protein
VLRNLILGFINRPFVRRIATGGLGRKVALRFVAGEDIDLVTAESDDLRSLLQ